MLRGHPTGYDTTTHPDSCPEPTPEGNRLFPGMKNADFALFSMFVILERAENAAEF